MIDYIIIIGLIIIIILILIAISKNINEANITERLGKLENTTIKEINNFRLELIKNTNDEFDKLNEMLEYRLTMMNEKINDRLDENFRYVVNFGGLWYNSSVESEFRKGYL